jgi:hypothetical protein
MLTIERDDKEPELAREPYKQLDCLQVFFFNQLELMLAGFMDN